MRLSRPCGRGMPVPKANASMRTARGSKGPSQGVRAFGLRRTRYWGLEKTHLQHVAIAAAINIDRLVAWLDERPRAKTRPSRFAALAPACTIPSRPLPGKDTHCPPVVEKVV